MDPWISTSGDRGDEASRACYDPPSSVDFPILYQKEKNCGGMKFCSTSSLRTAQN